MENNNTNYLSDETKEQLFDYQINSLERTITDYINQNREARSVVWKVCPKCHTSGNGFGKGGYTRDKNGNRKKPMLKCKACNHRFVTDHGQLSFYSHSDASVWNKLIEDTIEEKTLESTAADIDRHPVTVFRMRHKFLASIEPENESVVLTDTTEADEKFIHESHKGLVKAEIDDDRKSVIIYQFPRKKTSPGLGDDKVCIFTVVQRLGRSYLHTENMGKPSSSDTECLSNHIRNGVFVFTDGCTAYEDMLERKQCPYKPVKSGASSDSLNHLNNANSLHSKIDLWIRCYRNVNTIYINRYNALFSLRHKLAGKDTKEAAMDVICWLRNRLTYRYQKQQMEDIFDDPAVMKYRNGLVGMAYINRLKSRFGYTVSYAVA